MWVPTLTGLTPERLRRYSRRMTQDARRARDDARAVFRDLVPEFLGREGVDQGAMFGSEALRVHGKVVAFVDGEGGLVVKLPAARAESLVDSGRAGRVRIGRNEAREWVSLPPVQAGAEGEDGWRSYVEESLTFVASLHRA